MRFRPPPRRSSPALTPQAVLWDVHNHLLFQVDDGVRDVGESLQGVALLRDLGYRGAVVTPHIYREVFDNDEAMLIERFERMLSHIAEVYPDFRLQLGAEYMLDESLLDRLYHNPARLLRFGPQRSHVLVELPVTSEPLFLSEFLDECHRQGLRPIVAHAERYRFVAEDEQGMARVQSWRSRGALIQMNLESLVGRDGRTAQRLARMLWQAALIDIVGSDMHRPHLASKTLARAWDALVRSGGSFDPSRQRSLIAHDAASNELEPRSPVGT